MNPKGRLPDISSLEVRVSGRVQGVGFRYFAHKTARQLGLVGYVANLPDGSVRIYAEGARDVLNQFLQHVEKGPAGSTVRETRIHWGPATGRYTYFGIERVGR